MRACKVLNPQAISSCSLLSTSPSPCDGAALTAAAVGCVIIDKFAELMGEAWASAVQVGCLLVQLPGEWGSSCDLAAGLPFTPTRLRSPTATHEREVGLKSTWGLVLGSEVLLRKLRR